MSKVGCTSQNGMVNEVHVFENSRIKSLWDKMRMLCLKEFHSSVNRTISKELLLKRKSP
jgi:hypothetical protein